MNINVKRIFFLVFFFCLLSSSLYGQKRERKWYVMVVGVSDYFRPDIPKLTKPVSDADTVAQLFSTYNAEVLVLKNKEATGDSILSKMQTFFSRSTSYDNVLFFFSGHGYRSGFCPYDYGCTGHGYVSYDDIKNVFRRIRANGRIILADACFSGGLRPEQKPAQPDTVQVQQVLDPAVNKRKQQVMLFLSSRGYEPSYESPSMTNGYFTTYLKEALQGAADVNRNGKVTAAELHEYVSLKLKASLGDMQHSNMWGSFSKGWILARVPVAAPK